MLDLRDFIRAAEENGEYRLVEGADPELEIGSITALVAETKNPPVLMFDSTKGYEKGYRVVTLACAAALGFPPMKTAEDLVEFWRKKFKEEIRGGESVFLTAPPEYLQATNRQIHFREIAVI